jgi:RimJ/RimL family protein N-acetyltransferase
MCEVIKTDRLTLRPFVPKDAPRVIEILGNYAVSKWLSSVPHPFSAQDLKIFDPDSPCVWPNFMAVALGDTLIGAVNNKPQLGYWFAPEAHGNGYATEAVKAVCDFVVHSQKRAELLSGYYADNAASERVLQKCGFRETHRGPQISRARNETRPHVWVRQTAEHWGARS